MKKSFILIIFIGCALFSEAQDFKTDMNNARSAYQSGKYGDTHFALLQALQEVDIIIGKEVMKLLPAKMDTAAMVAKEDQVTGTTGFVGTTINRVYGKDRFAEVSIISNSPMIGTLNSFLNSPLLGGMMGSGDGGMKMVKIQGYKARLQKDGDEGYTVEIPLSSSLVTFKAKSVSDSKVLQMAETLPLDAIAKLIN
jgi:hypothetical protein